jgi:hypothetical protein
MIYPVGLPWRVTHGLRLVGMLVEYGFTNERTFRTFPQIEDRVVVAADLALQGEFTRLRYLNEINNLSLELRP